MRTPNSQEARVRLIQAAMTGIGFLAVTLTGAAEGVALTTGAPTWAELAIAALFLIGCLVVGLLAGWRALALQQRLPGAAQTDQPSDPLAGTASDDA